MTASNAILLMSLVGAGIFFSSLAVGAWLTFKTDLKFVARLVFALGLVALIATLALDLVVAFTTP